MGKYLDSYNSANDYLDALLNINGLYEPNVSIVSNNVQFSKHIDWVLSIDITANEVNTEISIINDTSHIIKTLYIDNELINFNTTLKHTFTTIGNHIILLSLNSNNMYGVLTADLRTLVKEITILDKHHQYTSYPNLIKANLKFYKGSTDFDNTTSILSATALEEICFPSSVTTIFNNTTYQLGSITRWNLPELNNLETLEFGALTGTSVNEIIFPKNLKYVDDNAFGSTKVTINRLDLGNVEQIGSAFNGCTFNNIDVIIPSSLNTFGISSENGIFNNATGINSVKFLSSVPPSGNSTFSKTFGDAKTIYIPKGSLRDYANTAYCTTFGSGAYDNIETNAQQQYNSYIQSHPLLENSVTYEEAVQYVKSSPGYQVKEIANNYPSYQWIMWKCSFIEAMLGNGKGSISYMANTDGYTIEEIEAVILDDKQYSTYTDLDNNIYDWKYFMIDENTGHFKNKYITTDHEGNIFINIDLISADLEDRKTELLQPWIDHYYAAAGPEAMEAYNNNIIQNAELEADTVRQNLRTQYRFDRIVEYNR